MTGQTDQRTVAAALGLLLLASACGGSAPYCANTGCGAPPMCGTGCTAVCGCCSCLPGQIGGNGSLVCTNYGCYEPTDGGTDSATDGGWTAAPACLMSFDPGPCRGAIPVYAFDGTACVTKTYGGCEGNDNRFTTLEECLAACEGRPTPNGCPDGRINQEICLGCGPAGGCASMATVCARTCDADAGGPGDCPSELGICYHGVCQAAFCI